MLRLAVIIVLSLSGLSFSQSSVRGTLGGLQGMSDKLVSYADSLVSRGIEPTNAILREKLFSMFDSLLVGEALDSSRAKVDSGLNAGWQLAGTDNFDWAFPLQFVNCGRSSYYLLFWNNEEAAVLCEKSEEDCGDVLEGWGSGVCLIPPSPDSAFRKIIYLIRTPAGWRINKIREPQEMAIPE
jgi:hypothetical protein